MVDWNGMDRRKKKSLDDIKNLIDINADIITLRWAEHLYKILEHALISCELEFQVEALKEEINELKKDRET